MTDPAPQVDEEDLVAVAAERETLEGFLEYHRRVLGGKLHGLSEEDMRRRLVPSPTTLRWIYVHIIREHARLIGHADILREQIDGATGD